MKLRFKQEMGEFIDIKLSIIIPNEDEMKEI
jgi:hypothetical protein